MYHVSFRHHSFKTGGLIPKTVGIHPFLLKKKPISKPFSAGAPCEGRCRSVGTWDVSWPGGIDVRREFGPIVSLIQPGRLIYFWRACGDQHI